MHASDEVDRNSDSTNSDSAVDSGRNILVLDIEGFEGPIDVLLKLARDQKVDLIHISILQLAEQYLAFVGEIRKQNLELAADYLVMAAWLAYLKSKLLLPDLPGDDEPSGEELANALAFQLRRLEAMREAGKELFNRKQLGIDFFSRGGPEDFVPNYIEITDVNLFQLLTAYITHVKRKETRNALRIEPFPTYSLEDSMRRLEGFLKIGVDWESLWKYLPENITDDFFGRSAVASTLVASLEMVKQGKLVIRQKFTFGPIYLSSKLKKTKSNKELP